MTTTCSQSAVPATIAPYILVIWDKAAVTLFTSVQRVSSPTNRTAASALMCCPRHVQFSRHAAERQTTAAWNGQPAHRQLATGQLAPVSHRTSTNHWNVGRCGIADMACRSIRCANQLTPDRRQTANTWSSRESPRDRRAKLFNSTVGVSSGPHSSPTPDVSRRRVPVIA